VACAEASLVATALTELAAGWASRNCGAKHCPEGGNDRAALTTWRATTNQMASAKPP